MSNDLGELTPDEVNLILQVRGKQARLAAQLRLRLKAIQVAAKYEEWLQANERGDSLSTFVNEFGYQGADCSGVHQLVQRIREAIPE